MKKIIDNICYFIFIKFKSKKNIKKALTLGGGHETCKNLKQVISENINNLTPDLIKAK